MRRVLTALVLFLLVCVPTISHAKTLYALAMSGQPKYAKDFQHLGYVNPNAPKGGTLHLAEAGTFDNLNGNIIIGNPAAGLDYLNDRLMQRAWDEPFTLYGLVAQSIDLAPDRSWVVFHLNKAARFHDGVPMTAQDVKFSFNAFRKYGHPVRRYVYGLVKTVKIIDPHTIKFTFGAGYNRESVMILALMPVLPAHYWKNHDVSQTTLTPPLGSGPYKIKSVDPGREIVYERVKNYWARNLPINKGFYNFDTIRYTYFRDDDVSLQSFKAGGYNVRREFDIAKWNTGYGGGAQKFTKEEIPHHRPEHLRAFVFNTRKKIFADRRVREALSDMINYKWLNRTFFYNALKVIDSTFPHSALAAKGTPKGAELKILEQYKADLPPEVFGPAYTPPLEPSRVRQRHAIALLEAAGWHYAHEKLVDAQGHPFRFEILLDNPEDEKIALSFSRELNKLGIEADVRTVDSVQFTGRLDDFDFDMVSFQWVNSLSPGNEQMNYWGSAAADLHGSRNYAGIKNPAIDALAASIAQTTDRQELVTRVHALDRALMWGHYMVPLFYLGRDLVAYGSGIRHPKVTPVYGVILESWWQTPKKQQP